MIFRQELLYDDGLLDHYHDDDCDERASWDAPKMTGYLCYRAVYFAFLRITYDLDSNE